MARPCPQLRGQGSPTRGELSLPGPGRRGSGNRVVGATRAITAPTTFSRHDYAAQVLGDGATLYWPVGDPSGGFRDRAGSNDSISVGGVEAETPGVIAGDSVRLGAATNPRIYARGTEFARTEVSKSVWFKTTDGAGRILGFDDNPSEGSGHRDRQIYLSDGGRINFGFACNGGRAVTRAARYNDDGWHQVVATLPGSTTELYVDRTRVGRGADIAEPEVYIGQWRLGWDSMSGWPIANEPAYAGELDEMSIFPAALTADQVQQHYVAAGGVSEGTGTGVARLSGTDRFGTAAVIAQSYPPGLDTVYVASGLNFPDALAGAALAGKNNAPVLLVKPDEIPEQSTTALDTLNPKRIVILGGTSAVNDHQGPTGQLRGYTR
ncbi:MAG: cell wall-binding repeat-containing protein [Actinobacteria bacterium]|nr:cell wall-binding repeat-containing protein [Actinomycetota bacterium]